MENQKNNLKEKQKKLFIGCIIFGITLPIGFFIIVHFGSQIEFKRNHSIFSINILLWFIEWMIILSGIFLPYFTWKKLIKPYKDF